MKKNISIIILIMITFLPLVYAFFQQTAAEKARVEAEMYLVLAKAAQSEADKQRALAQTQVELAQKFAEQAEIELAKCREKK